MDESQIAAAEMVERPWIDIAYERSAQTHEFTSEADDELLPAEWVARIAKHLGRSVSTNPETFRQEMVVVGALALAAIESFDRTRVSNG